MTTNKGRVHDERGSVTLWAMLIVVTFTLIVGISVDLTGQVHAKQQAADVATQAARVGGQQVNPDTLMGGRPITEVQALAAKQAALRFVAGAGMTGTVTIEGGARLSVTTTATYRPVFLSSLGFGPMTVTGTSTARLIRSLDGSER